MPLPQLWPFFDTHSYLLSVVWPAWTWLYFGSFGFQAFEPLSNKTLICFVIVQNVPAHWKIFSFFRELVASWSLGPILLFLRVFILCLLLGSYLCIVAPVKAKVPFMFNLLSQPWKRQSHHASIAFATVFDVWNSKCPSLGQLVILPMDSWFSYHVDGLSIRDFLRFEVFGYATRLHQFSPFFTEWRRVMLLIVGAAMPECCSTRSEVEQHASFLCTCVSMVIRIRSLKGNVGEVTVFHFIWTEFKHQSEWGLLLKLESSCADVLCCIRPL